MDTQGNYGTNAHVFGRYNYKETSKELSFCKLLQKRIATMEFTVAIYYVMQQRRKFQKEIGGKAGASEQD